jgi:7-carboxy-7-deazaguanine synthase
MSRNEQAPEKRVQGDGFTLQVNSIFHTIQGEGPFAGTPAVFVRLAGCNLQCPLCDTAYTERLTMSVDEIIEAVEEAVPHWPSGRRHNRIPYTAPTKLVVITGGEPMRQPIGHLCWKLIKQGWRVQVETNGTLFQGALPYTHEDLTIVCSPKAGGVHRDLLPWIAAWKYVATANNIDPVDGLPTHALEHPNGGKLYRPPAGHDAPVFLQPVDEKDMKTNLDNMDAVVRACLEHGHRLCLQLHKLIGVA